MRRFGGLGVLCAMAALAQVQPPQHNREPAIAEGQVLNIATGQPVTHASVTIRPRVESPNPENTPGGYAMETDDAGTFHFEKLQPGKYELWASKVGFLRTNYGARRANGAGVPVTLEVGKTAGKLDIKMYPEGTISGVVTDDKGEPVAARVSLMKRMWIQGRPSLMPQGGSSSDSHGHYLISGVAPGRYLLQVQIQSLNERDVPMQVDREGNPISAHLVTTYFGDTTDQHSATTITIQAGQEVNGANIRVLREPTFRIKGRIVSVPPNEPPQSYTPFLMPRDTFGYIGGFAMRTKDRLFEIDNVQPGSYTLNVAHGGTGSGLMIPVEVSNGDIDNLEISIPTPVDLQGRLFVDNHPEMDISGILVQLQGEQFALESQVMSGKDGTFTFKNVAPRHYKVNVYAPAQTVYIKNVRFSGKEAGSRSIDVEQSGANLEIELGDNPAQVEGVVTKTAADGQATLSAVAVNVVAIPENKSNDFFSGMRWASTDAQGHFTTKGLEPGRYRFYASEGIDNNQWTDPEVAAALSNQATLVEVHEGDKKQVQLKLIPEAEALQLLERLGL